MTHSRKSHCELADLLGDARRRTLLLVDSLSGGQWLGPKLDIVNPPLWEIGHLAWFQEFWCLRGGDFNACSILSGADSLYDSARVAHDTRWSLPLPDLEGTLSYLQSVLERVLERLDAEPKNDKLAYFAELALYHEDMHGEAFAYTRQTLGYRRPAAAGASRDVNRAGPLPGDVSVFGGEFDLGAKPDDGFVFDNEKWAHPVRLRPFRIARAPVTNAEYLTFVEDGGYGRLEFWDQQGQAWLEKERTLAPVYWIKNGDNWMVRMFNEIVPLPLEAPVIHVNWFEANAFCHWAGRRLPSEPEWEVAASVADGTKRRYPWGDQPPTQYHAHLDGDNWQCADVAAYPEGDTPAGCRQMLGNVWEWTADTFLPYPGFLRDPYKEYSEPWFGDDHKVLRGGCYATRARLLRNTWRNFYTPDRRDVFAGFRTCALDHE